MNTFRIASSFATLAVASLALVACGAQAPGGSDGSSVSAESTSATCYADTDCGSSQICQPYCPVIPGQIHCDIAGGQCVTKQCMTDSDCGTDRVCNLYCPVIPGQMHCNLAGGTCGACPWVNGYETSKALSASDWKSSDTLIDYHFNTDGTFQSVKEPACTLSQPRCMIMVAPKHGHYWISSHDLVHLTYDDGTTATLDAQVNCKNAVRLTGTDYATTVTVFQQ
jgi:hypothetical protein